MQINDDDERAVYKVVKYPSRQYKYHATAKEHLAQHKKSEHKGVRCSCR